MAYFWRKRYLKQAGEWVGGGYQGQRIAARGDFGKGQLVILEAPVEPPDRLIAAAVAAHVVYS